MVRVVPWVVVRAPPARVAVGLEVWVVEGVVVGVVVLGGGGGQGHRQEEREEEEEEALEVGKNGLEGNTVEKIIVLRFWTLLFKGKVGIPPKKKSIVVAKILFYFFSVCIRLFFFSRSRKNRLIKNWELRYAKKFHCTHKSNSTQIQKIIFYLNSPAFSRCYYFVSASETKPFSRCLHTQTRYIPGVATDHSRSCFCLCGGNNNSYVSSRTIPARLKKKGSLFYRPSSSSHAKMHEKK